MGIVTGTFGLIVGLLLTFFPGPLSKFLVVGQYSIFGPVKEKGEIKIKSKRKIPTIGELIGEKKSKIVLRSLGIICLVLSIFAYISPNAP